MGFVVVAEFWGEEKTGRCNWPGQPEVFSDRAEAEKLLAVVRKAPGIIDAEIQDGIGRIPWASQTV